MNKGPTDVEADALLGVMNEIVNVRSFAPDPVAPEISVKLLEALRLGPSTANTQPWELVSLQSPDRREILAGATLDPLRRPVKGGGQRWITQAPLLWLVAIDRKRAESRVGPAGFLQAAEDCFAAIQNLRVTAGSLGLATAVAREFDHRAVAEAVRLPWWVEPLCLVAAGYSDGPRELPPRLPVERFLHREEW